MTQGFIIGVLLMTYNHGPFIEQAVRSVLDQRTDFPFEILVAEDHSTDDTPRIVARLEAENPGRLRVLRRGRNLGMQRMDDALTDLFQAGLITGPNAILYSRDPKAMEMRVRQANAGTVSSGAAVKI